MISQLLLDKAAVLPKCKTLSDAERQLGGDWDGEYRDCKVAVVTWGLWDGWKGRPKPEQLALGKEPFSTYAEAWEAGRRIALQEVVG